ncbi:MAG: 50S ribosome-binding GTPase [Pirellulales bacterium]|nr:50S ribosome-binding GTPase [Pirellulales bacterium]
MSLPQVTSAALLTPAGRGAIATIGLRGPDAFRQIERFFLPHGRRSIAPTGNAVRVGRWRDATGEEIVVSASASDRWEICCHGGRAAAAAILNDLASAGCTIVDWQAWLAGESTRLLDYEAQAALAEAKTVRAASILLDQFEGALECTCRTILELLSGAAASPVQADRAREMLLRLDAWSALGLHLTAPWHVVLAGAPNVGKSSLINAIVGYERSLVFDRPGTTRDAVTVDTALEGWPVRLVDTAGLREAADAIETAGIERTQSHVARADLVILVQEARHVELHEAVRLPAEQSHVLVVANKCDLLPAERIGGTPAAVLTSAVTGAGVDDLIHAIAGRLVPGTPQPGEAVPFTPRHVGAIREAQGAAAAGAFDAARSAVEAILLAPT